MTTERFLRWLGPLALAALLPLGVASCNQGDRDRAQQQTDTLSSELRDAGGQIGDSLDQLGEDARRIVEQAGEDLRSTSKDVREAAARNGVSVALEGEFHRHGVDLTGTPTCAATSDAVGQYHVECSAQTTDGKAASLVGDDPGEAPSAFVGTVDGQEVFRQSCVGLC
jgi:hypothetical protein